MNKRTIGVVMPIWQRPELLAGSLALFAAQTDRNFDLVLVCNNPDLAHLVAQSVDEGPQRATIIHNDTNRGSRAKIEVGYELAVRGYPWIVLVDDDFLFGPDFLTQLRQQARKDALVSWRCHTLTPGGTYWDRTATAIGAEGHYVEGTGTIIPAAALLDPGVLEISAEHSPADNLWLSFYANHKLGFKLVQGDIRGCQEQQDGKNQYIHHCDMKVRFLQELRARGWRV